MAMIHARGYELRQMMTLRYEVTEEVPRYYVYKYGITQFSL